MNSVLFKNPIDIVLASAFTRKEKTSSYNTIHNVFPTECHTIEVTT